MESVVRWPQLLPSKSTTIAVPAQIPFSRTNTIIILINMAVLISTLYFDVSKSLSPKYTSLYPSGVETGESNV